MGDSPLTLRMRKGGVIRRVTEPVIPLEQAPDAIPEAAPAAIRFLQALNDSDFEGLAFSDRLVSYSDNGKEIGTFSVSVAPYRSASGDGDGLHVRAVSVGKIDGMPCGTKVAARISRNLLETIEHHQHDFLLKEDNLKRETEIVKQKDGFLISRTVTHEQDVQKTSKFIESSRTVGFISEAADLILQRILILKGLPSDFSVLSLDMNGNIASAAYKKLVVPGETSCGTAVESVFGLSRTIFSWNDKPLTWHSHFSGNGRLTYRRHIGASVSMRLPPGNSVTDVSALSNCPGAEKTNSKKTEPSNLNGKAKSVVDTQTYLRQHPELRTITTDFLQLLFLHKPANVPVFAANYFSSLASEMDASEMTTVKTT